MRQRSKSSNALLSRRPKSANYAGVLSKSKSKAHIKGSQTARKRQKSSNSKIIPWTARKRHPRIDDGVKKRYPEWRLGNPHPDDPMIKRSPGPIYVPKDGYVLYQPPKWSLGKLIDDTRIADKRSPGPVYNPKYHFTHYDAPKFSFIARREIKTFSQTTPAPNCYDPTKSAYYKSSKIYTIKGRISKRTDTLSDTPGPTAYNIDKSMRKVSILSTKIGKRLPDMTQNYLNSVPGPAQYIPKYEQTLNQSSKWTMGRRRKIIDSRDDNPGPGYYGPSLVPPYKRKKKKKMNKKKKKRVVV